MLSIGSRDEGRKGIGLGLAGFGGVVAREMEENELEEGEAYSGQEDDAAIDPDIALSYIDEKIQNVLGHFQKDFEGGVCAENLGAKFGGYGSFLPAYQRSPSILPQCRSPQKSNYSTSRSPCNAQYEGAHQQIDTTRISAVPLTNGSSFSAQLLDNSVNKNVRGTASNDWESNSPQHDSVSKQTYCNDQKTFKVRVKMGPDKVPARNNAAIYSGLGLDVSPSSSVEESIDGSQHSSPEPHDAPGDSPMTVFQFYNSMRVPPHGSLLSPVPKSMLFVLEKEKTQMKNSKIVSGMLTHGSSGLPSGEILPKRNIKSSSEKKSKLAEKNSRPIEVKKSKNKAVGNDITGILVKEINIETPAGREIVSNALNIPLLSTSTSADEDMSCQFSQKAAKSVAISQGADRFVDKENNLSTDFGKEEVEPADSLDVNKFTNGGTISSNSKTKVSVKPFSCPKSLEESRGSLLVDNAMTAPQKDFEGAEYEGPSGRKDHAVGPAESVKLKAPQRDISYQKVGGKVLQDQEKSSASKRKSKGGQPNDQPSSEFSKEYSDVAVARKEKKKSMNSKTDKSESTYKSLKSQRDSIRIPNREYHTDNAGHAQGEKKDGKPDYHDSSSREKPKEHKFEYDMNDLSFSDKIKEKSGRQKFENLPEVEHFDKSTNMLPGIDSNAIPQPSVPQLIEENWVACDRCQKWRLLPYGTNSSGLPKIWVCSMLNWLPGMNRCNISEEETTKALHALYQLPASEGLIGMNSHHDIANSSITTQAQHVHQKHDFAQHVVPGVAKKRPTVKDVPVATGQSSLIQVMNSSRENYENPTQIRSQAKPTVFTAENQSSKSKEKQKMSEQYLDRGDIFERKGETKSKSRREINLDGPRNSKKLKLQDSHHSDVNCLLNDDDLGGKFVLDGLSSKTSGRASQKCKDSSSSKDLKVDSKNKSPASRKKMKVAVHINANGEVKERQSTLDIEKSDIAKKRKVKEWQEGGFHPHPIELKEEADESEARKQKKLRVSKTNARELSVSKLDRQAEINNRRSGEFEESRAYADKDQLVTQKNADYMDSFRKDLGRAQPSAAATSSSSKVSGSHKSKGTFQEARDSPVESVSSSPFRISNIDVLTTKRSITVKRDATDTGYIMSSPRRSIDCEVGDACGPFEEKRNVKSIYTENGSLESNRGAESSVLDPMRGSCNLQVKEADGHAAKAKDLLFAKIFGHTNDEPSPLEYEETVKGDGATINSDEPHKCNSELRGKASIFEQDKHDSYYHINGSNDQKKFVKSSSAGFRERQKNSKTDKGKKKQSDEFSDQEGLYSEKNGQHNNSGGTTSSHVHSSSCGDFKDNIQEKREHKNYLMKISGSGSGEGKKENYSNPRPQENTEMHDSSPLINKNSISKLALTSGNCVKLQENLYTIVLQDEEKSSSRVATDRMDKLEVASSGRVKLDQQTRLSTEKHDSKSCASRLVPAPVKGSKYEISAKTANPDADYVPKSSSKIEQQNGTSHDSFRHLTPNRLDVQASVRKEGGHSAAGVLKEARNLKHTANHLKNEGLVHESTGLYFQAALKFLHVALLLEPSNFESAKPNDMISSVQMYSDTARLCEFCAHDYEKRKEMAAAALAYKCMEVAYMKVVYSKHSVANKDRHELQIAPQMLVHGESPSSSASDIDNLNNSNMIDKAVSVKGVNSPKIASSHVIGARNRPNFVRLLGFAEDVNFAMEASKKSLNAFAAASSNFAGGERTEAMSSVKRVLDFSFHDVEGLLRLVRLSMEHFNR